jgi:hypothetical protein
MADQFPRGKVSVAGAATFGYSTIELAAKAACLALDDAAIPLAHVDGLFIALPDDLFAGLSLAQYLGIHPRFTDNNRAGGASFMSHLVTATLMLDAGYLDCAVIAYGSNQRSRIAGMGPTIRFIRSRSMRSPLRATCISSARRANNWRKWPFQRAPGPTPIPKPSPKGPYQSRMCSHRV